MDAAPRSCLSAGSVDRSRPVGIGSVMRLDLRPTQLPNATLQRYRRGNTTGSKPQRISEAQDDGVYCSGWPRAADAAIDNYALR